MIEEAPDRSRRLDVRGLALAWHEWGAASAPVALCLHGFMDHGRAFAAVGAALRGALRVVAPDMRGHGDSGWVGAGGYYHFYDYFDDVRRVVDALGCERLLLVGHSMGGSVATGTAALLGARVRALVLLEGMGPAFADLTRTRGRLGRWVAALGQPAVDGDVAYRRRRRRVMSNIEEAAERLRRFNPRLSEARSRALAGSFTEPVEHGVAWRFDPLHRTPAAKPFVLEEARALWAAVEAPTLSLFGELGFGPPDLADRHAALREVRAGVLPGVGHNIHHERPDVVARVLLEAHQTGQVCLPEEATEA